jgi:homoserine O-acetyltransferase
MKIKSSFGPSSKEFEIGDVVKLAQNSPLKLSCGVDIKNFPIAYQTYGKLNSDKSNAILICHALTGDQYVASDNPVMQKKGWWDFMIGENKPIDTNKFFVICSNIIGGCMGSFGPKEINPDTNLPYGNDFPFLTIQDMVRAQNLLIESFGITKLHAVIGVSVGGMQVLSWAVLFPHKVKILIPMATSYRHTPQNIAFHEVGRQAIINDPDWCAGNYISQKKFPKNGLALARMTAHITYLSESSLQRKFGRDLTDKEQNSAKNNHRFAQEKDFEVENYLHYQGEKFTERFDPNSYLTITRAVDYFDLESDYSGNLSGAFFELSQNKNSKICVISFSDDWLFPPSESKKLIYALSACGVNVSSVVINSDCGHDSFLIKNEILEKTICGIINEK